VTNGMNVANKAVLITGANLGVGRALVNQLHDAEVRRRRDICAPYVSQTQR
jgi:NAD(P)-dependent dehydrogenase (short-subunit alcohol dehydrogenase family)